MYLDILAIIGPKIERNYTVQTAANLPPGMHPTVSYCILPCLDVIKIANDHFQNKNM